MKQLFKRSVNAILGHFGYEVRRKALPGKIVPSDSFDAQQRLIDELRPSTVTILDVGANQGHTAQSYRARFPSAEIYCFEPFPDSIRVLESTFRADSRIHIIPKAVSQRSGRSTFHVNGFDPTNSLLSRPSAGRRYYPKYAMPKGTIEVDVISLDEFVAAREIPAIDILKFDIQGGELMALRGATTVLDAASVSLIYSEIMFVPHYEGGPLFHEIWSFLEEFGYSLYDIYNIVRAANGQIRCADALFVNELVRNKAVDEFAEEA